MNKDKLIVLTGPTAVGKTALSIELARAVNGEIISADSMQVYKGMDIGSAKIKEEEKQGIKHYLIDILEPTEEFNVVLFQHYAKLAMAEIYKKGKIPIIVGGTGFYIQSVLYDIDFTSTDKNDKLRKKYENMADELGVEALHDVLKKVDPVSAEKIPMQNVKRVIRALEFYEETGTAISAHNEEQQKKESPYNFAYFVLNDERESLYKRINMRVDMMLDEGLLSEVGSLRNKGLNSSMVSMQGLGYKEILDYLDGKLSLEEAVDIIKKNTRHFAKRQITWFKREKELSWVNKNEFAYDDKKILDYMLGILKRKEII